MVYRVVVMPSAEQDLSEYADFIALNSEPHAREWLATAWEQIFSLAEDPLRFAKIPDTEELGAELRGLLYGPHRIIYLVKEAEKTVEIIRVYHGGRRPLTTDDLR